MWIVNISTDGPTGFDPFIAQTKPAIKRGLNDLYDGVETSRFETKTMVRITYIDNIGIELNVVAYKTEYYK